MTEQILIELVDENEQFILPKTRVPTKITKENLEALSGIKTEFYYNGQIITTTLENVLKEQNETEYEGIFRIRTNAIQNKEPGMRSTDIYSGHESAILSVVMKGDLVVTAAGDCTTRFWSVKNKKQIKILKAHENWVLRVIKEKNKIVTCGADGKLVIYNEENCVEKTIKIKNGILTAVEIFEDFFICGCRDGEVKILKENGEIVFTYFHEKSVTEIKKFENGIVSVGRDKKIKIINFRKNIEIKKTILLNAEINCLTILNNNLVVGDENGGVTLYKSFVFAHKNYHSAPVVCVASHCERFYASGSFDKTVKIISFESGNILATYSHLNRVYQLLTFDDYVVSCSKDSTIIWFKISKKEISNKAICKDEVYCLASDDGKIVAGCKDRFLYFYY